MVIRLTQFKVSANDTDELKEIYSQEVVPEVKKQQGNINAMLLEPLDGSGEFVSLTTWENKADAEGYESSGKYRELVAKLNGIFDGKPVLKSYNT